MSRSASIRIVAVLTIAAATNPGLARDDDDEMAAIDCGNASTTYELNSCADRDFMAADAELNRVYKKALSAIPQMATGDPQYNAKAWTEALRASQRAWITFRDADCKGHVAMFWSGGTGTTADVIGCMETLTQARVKELKNRYDAP